ncbi:MAG TPA: hypothetical protein VGC41_08420 [Kofleriaceae bacterium]
MTDVSSTLDGLHRKLGRELLQSERDCRLHTRREAHRQGPGAPSEALLAIAHHADACEPRLVELLAASPLELGVARAVAHAFSNLRYGFFDRVLAHERTYRATLLGVRHDLDLAKLLFSVADRREMTGMRRFLSEMVPRRAALLVDAVAALEWFADHPLQAAGHS